MKTFLKIALIVGNLFLLSACGIQAIPQSKNNVDAALAEVSNQYKRRADLVPNLVNVVKGYAKHEEQTLTNVVEARAKATQITIDPSKVTPDQLAKFQAAQGQLSQALGRLLAVSENYPNLKADTQFRDLQAQLEGTENRITIAESIRDFNNLVTVPPTSWTNGMMYHYAVMPQWDLAPEEKAAAEKAPEVKF